MSLITGETDKNLLKFNGPFRIISTNDDDNGFKISENNISQVQTFGQTTIINSVRKAGETIKFENCKW